MRHSNSGKKLSRTPAHRKALLHNLAKALLIHGRIRTTEVKAKELRGVVEPLISLAKRNDLHARRLAYRVLCDYALVKRLFELEVPEIHSGIVEVKSIAREAGNRTKIAVVSHDENVDPIGACVGTRGARVANITGELNGEKIDIIKWNEDMAQFVSAALAPADVINATMQADNKSCRVIVPDDQLSLAIGKEGQNARLAAKLTGCKIDIAPESQGE